MCDCSLTSVYVLGPALCGRLEVAAQLRVVCDAFGGWSCYCGGRPSALREG